MAQWRFLGRGVAVAAILAAEIGAPCAAAENATFEMARQALQTGRFDLAIGALNSVIGKHVLKGPDLVKALYWRGLLLEKSGKSALALADLDAALKSPAGLGDDDKTAALIARATAYSQLTAPSATAAGSTSLEQPAYAESLPWQVAGASAPAAFKIKTPPPGSDGAFDSMLGGLFSFGIVAPVVPASADQPASNGTAAAAGAPATPSTKHAGS